MSAGAPLIHTDLDDCAPLFAVAVHDAIGACERAGYDAMVAESLRTNEVQELYYRRGRPPTAEYPGPVTHARTAMYSWHGYGLAVDVISRSRAWFRPLRILNPTPDTLAAEARRAIQERDHWYAGVSAIFKAHGLDWGGDWRAPKQDLPHFQWGTLKPSPSEKARALYAAGGLEAVWRAVGAVAA